jgi:hypothetical protein
MFDASLPRTGRLARQIKRCFLAQPNGIATTTQIRAWCYPGRERQHWMYRNMRRTLRQLGAVQLGRSPTGVGRPAIWALDACVEKPSQNSLIDNQ